MTVLFFANGNTAVLDGQQVPELQVPWILQYVAFLESKGIDPMVCTFVFPNGQRAQVFRTDDGGWNWTAVA